MSVETAVGQLVREFRANGRIVIVGASLTGLRAAEALRRNGFTGSLTIIGDEDCGSYDRPPLSKQVFKGPPKPFSVVVAILSPSAGPQVNRPDCATSSV